MIRRDQIPDESFDAAMAVVVKDGLRAAIAAALSAWPDIVDTHPDNIGHIVLQFKQVSDE